MATEASGSRPLLRTGGLWKPAPAIWNCCKLGPLSLNKTVLLEELPFREPRNRTGSKPHLSDLADLVNWMSGCEGFGRIRLQAS